ncbi:Vacuolar protein sorting-associated protein 17, variant 2 [Basidiobolus ranarum]|uniref:Vacuolar protein sorting-associated protein 17, variant 2 n=1 Tax=Basidiobolus ranarum TaxID=34480 RepID=A0ABR2W8V6_9FUNG
MIPVANSPFVSSSLCASNDGNLTRIIELKAPTGDSKSSKHQTSGDYSYLLPNFLSSGHLHSSPDAYPTPAPSPSASTKSKLSELVTPATPATKDTFLDYTPDDINSSNEEVKIFYPKVSGHFLSFHLISLEHVKKEYKLRFDVKTNIPNYVNSKFSNVERSYSEFEKLHKYLINAYPECIVPLLPVKETEFASEELAVALIKNGFQLYLSRLSAHPILRRDDELQSFVESNFAYTPRIKTGTLKTTRYKAKALHGEPDPLDAAYESLVSFEKAIVPCNKVVNKMQSARKVMVDSEHELSRQLSNWSEKEKDVLLSRYLCDLIKTVEISSTITQTQNDYEAGHLSYLFTQYHKGTQYIETLLQNRLSVEKEYEKSVETLEKKRQALIVLKASGTTKSDQVQAGIDDFEEVNPTS